MAPFILLNNRSAIISIRLDFIHLGLKIIFISILNRIHMSQNYHNLFCVSQNVFLKSIYTLFKLIFLNFQ